MQAFQNQVRNQQAPGVVVPNGVAPNGATATGGKPGFLQEHGKKMAIGAGVLVAIVATIMIVK